MTGARFLATAQKLLSIASTEDQPEKLHEALALIVTMLAKQPGVTVERFEHNSKPSLLAYYGPTRPRRFRVLLNGHLDVVPAHPMQFVPQVRDGKLYGRGAADMKVAALVMAEVFCKYAAAVPSLGLQIVTDEEVGGADGTLHQVEQGVQADFVIAGEDTPPASICTDMRGVCQVEVTLKGKAAHSAYPWLGENALLQATAFTAKLLKTYPVPKRDMWHTTINVASITTPNNTFNRVPDQATVRLDCRYTTNDPNFRSQVAVQQFLHTLEPSAAVTVYRLEPPHHADPNDSTLRLLSRSMEEVTGSLPAFIKRHGASDVRYFSARGMEAVTLGLPDNNTHGDDEYVELTDITNYQATLENFLVRVAARESEPPAEDQSIPEVTGALTSDSVGVE